MTTGNPVPIRFPLSSFPGASTQESAGRLVNCYAEPLGEAKRPSGPSDVVYRASPGLSQFTIMPTGQTGYRGGLLVGSASYEVWAGNLSSISSTGLVTSLGTVTGTKKVSIAHNLAGTPNVIIVDVDNGAYQTTGGAAPSVYNGGGVLPVPNSVCFQDGYLFFTIADGRCFATQVNSLTVNALTFITAQSKADVALLRGIAYSGNLFLFTTGGLEIWTDTAQPFPAFPYSRLMILPFGLVQQAAIAGWETGFDNMIWVGPDFGVYMLPWGSFQPIKISTADVERFCEAQNAAGNLLEAACYAFAGKKFWTITSNNALTTFEFNVVTQEWNERQSLLMSSGQYVRWRATGGHLAFGKWLMGDVQGSSLLFLDDTQFTENATPQLMRIESGPVEAFPHQLRIARADFDFVFGVGQAVGNLNYQVIGTLTGLDGSGNIWVQLNNTANMATGDQVTISGVNGTTEANGTWTITVLNQFFIALQGSVFVHAWTNGGMVLDVTTPPNVQSPSVAISCSKDGGINWGNPLIRQLGQQMLAKRQRVSVKNLGLSGPQGVRWRIDITDPVYRAFLKATMASDPREVGL